MERTFRTLNPMAGPAYQQCRDCCLETLAAAMAVHRNVKQAHWNVKGVNALDTHRYFDEIAGLMIGHADTMGERVVQLGGFAIFRPELADFAPISTSLTTSAEYTAAVADDLRKYIELLHGHVTMTGERHDLVGQNIFLDMAEASEKHLMFLEMNLQG